MEFYIAQAISIATTALTMLIMHCKSMKKMLLGHIVANLLSGTTFLLLGGFSGCGVCFIAIAQTIVMYLYNRKDVTPPIAVTVSFILLYIGCSAYYFQSFIDIFSALGAISYALSVAQRKPSASRFWYLFNPLFWFIYSVHSGAYANIIMHTVVFTSTAAAIVKHDLPQWRKKQS